MSSFATKLLTRKFISKLILVCEKIQQINLKTMKVYVDDNLSLGKKINLVILLTF